MAAILQTTFSNAISSVRISNKISLEFFPSSPAKNKPALVQTQGRTEQVASHFSYQWYPLYWRINASLGGLGLLKA